MARFETVSAPNARNFHPIIDLLRRKSSVANYSLTFVNFPKISRFNFYIFIYIFLNTVASAVTWKLDEIAAKKYESCIKFTL